MTSSSRWMTEIIIGQTANYVADRGRMKVLLMNSSAVYRVFSVAVTLDLWYILEWGA